MVETLAGCYANGKRSRNMAADKGYIKIRKDLIHRKPSSGIRIKDIQRIIKVKCVLSGMSSSQQILSQHEAFGNKLNPTNPEVILQSLVLKSTVLG